MGDVVIRSARVDESDAVAALAAATFPDACPASMPEVAIRAYIDAHLSPARIAEHLMGDQAEVIVGERAGELVGYVLLFRGDAGRPPTGSGVTVSPTALLSKCYVRAGVRGGGVAAQLLDAALEWGRTEGLGGLWLNVNHANHRAQRFYAKHGWERVGELDFLVGDVVNHDPVYQYPLD